MSQILVIPWPDVVAWIQKTTRANRIGFMRDNGPTIADKELVDRDLPDYLLVETDINPLDNPNVVIKKPWTMSKAKADNTEKK